MDLGQIFTSEYVADYMTSLFDVDKKATILEPCFGEGAFIKSCLSKGYRNICGYELDEKLYKSVKKKYPHIALHNQDFLSLNAEQQYDIIIMNPPYIRHEKINELHNYGITKELLAKNDIFHKLPKSANLYMYFIFKAISLLKNSGELIVIFPCSWLKSRSGRTFEKALYSKCSLKKQIHISGEVFEQKALVEVVILALVKGNISNEAEIKELEIINGQISDTSLDISEKKIGFGIKFEKYATVRRGLTTGFNSMFVNPKLKSDLSCELLTPIISSPKSVNGYSTKNSKTDTLLTISSNVILKGELQEYIKVFEEHILNSKAPKTLYEKIKKNVPWYNIKPFDSKGIVFSYFVRNDMKFINNKQGTLVRDNFYVIYPQIDNMLLFALLNNYYTYFQLEKCGKKYGAGLLKIQKYDIEGLTFPNIDHISKEDIKRLIDLAILLHDKSNPIYIDEITRIIALYSDTAYEEITVQYQRIKKYRLEGCANVN